MCGSPADDPTQHDTPVITHPRRYVLSGTPDTRPVRMSSVSRPYWAAIPEEERERIEAAVPEGHVLYLSPGHRGKPGTADVSLRRAEPGNRWTVVRSVRGYVRAGLLWSVLGGEVVTTDAAGFVTSIEEAS